VLSIGVKFWYETISYKQDAYAYVESIQIICSKRVLNHIIVKLLIIGVVFPLLEWLWIFGFHSSHNGSSNI